MNDITALAQREKFEAWWEENYHNGNPPLFGWAYWRESGGYKIEDDEPELDGMWNAWQAASVALVEVLEARDKQVADYAARLNRLEKRCDHKGSVYWDVSGVKRCARCGAGIQVIEGEQKNG